MENKAQCRCCLKINPDRLFNLTANFNGENSILKVLIFVTGIQIDEKDEVYLPEFQFVCLACMQKIEVAYEVKTISKNSEKHLQNIRKERIEQNLSIEEQDPLDIGIKVEPVLEVTDIQTELVEEVIDIKTELVEDKTENINDTENRQYLDPNEYGLSALQDILGGPDSSETESAPEKDKANDSLKKGQRKRKKTDNQEDFHSSDTDYDPSKEKKNIRLKKSDQESSDVSSRRRKKVSDSQKKFKCSVCKRIFLSKHNRTLHIRNAHAFNEKTHVCFMSDCRIGFESERQLKIHVDRVHLKVKEPYFCPNCDAKFSTAFILKKHCLKKHNLILNDGRKQRKTESDNKN